MKMWIIYKKNVFFDVGMDLTMHIVEPNLLFYIKTQPSLANNHGSLKNIKLKYIHFNVNLFSTKQVLGPFQ